VYVDETKAKGYVLVACTGARAQMQVARKELRELVLPGQRALHMQSEQDARRRKIADAIARMGEQGIEATIYDAGKRGPNERARRERCLEALVEDVSRHDQAQITFDRDESLVSWDRQRMIEFTRAVGAKQRLTHVHTTRQAELLLAIPDAVAWCWARGGHWRRRVGPIVRELREV